jgi:ATP-dependent Clp protease ATP-binding subunit ClpC
LFFARYEASQAGSPYIEAEHLLLGIAWEERRMLAQMLGSGKTKDRWNKNLAKNGERDPEVSTSVYLF